MQDITWAQFLEQREGHRRAALSLARALRSGAPGAPMDLEARLPPAAAALRGALLEATPSPPPQALVAALAPPESLPPAEAICSVEAHRSALLERADPAQANDADPLAWALVQLGWAYADVRARWREGWRSALRAPAEPQDVTGVWAGLFSGDPWAVWRDLEALALPPARRSFRAVMASRSLPEARQREVLRDLEDGLLGQLLGPKGYTPGWMDLAARTLEFDAEGPISALLRRLPEPAWAKACACLTGRGLWARTVEALVDRPRPGDRAAGLVALVGGDPARFEALVDLHLASRLLARWSEGRSTSPEGQRRVLDQNLGRVRGRLRALLAQAAGAELLEPVVTQDQLQARTLKAVAQHAWAWAWRDISWDFPFSGVKPVTAPCAPPEHWQPGFSDADLQALQTWLLLVALQGRLNHLERWLREGRTGDQDSTWGRLLSDKLPAALRDSGPHASRYLRLRGALSVDINEHLSALMPTIRDLCAIEGRGAPRRFIARLEVGWHPSVPMPKRRQKGYPENLRRALERRPPQGEDPWSQ